MARNTQLLLLQESHVGFVSDPAAVAAITTSRPAPGNWPRPVGRGCRRSRVARRHAERRLDSGLQSPSGSGTHPGACGSDRTRNADWRPVTGVSEFPDREPPRRWRRAGSDRAGGLPQHRYGRSVRGAAGSLRRRPAKPTVALITWGLGTIGATTQRGRETYAQNLFAAGGVTTVSVPYVPDEPLDLPDGTSVVCIWRHGRRLRRTDRAGLRRLSRRPRRRRHDASWSPASRAIARTTDAAAGVSGHIYVGCDALAVLEQTLADLEVPA